MACFSRYSFPPLQSSSVLYLAVFESLVENSCPGSQQPDTQVVQHHPFAPVNHTICQLTGVEGMDSSSKALCNTLER